MQSQRSLRSISKHANHPHLLTCKITVSHSKYKWQRSRGWSHMCDLILLQWRGFHFMWLIVTPGNGNSMSRVCYYYYFPFSDNKGCLLQGTLCVVVFGSRLNADIKIWIKLTSSPERQRRPFLHFNGVEIVSKRYEVLPRKAHVHVRKRRRTFCWKCGKSNSRGGGGGGMGWHFHHSCLMKYSAKRLKV